VVPGARAEARRRRPKRRLARVSPDRPTATPSTCNSTARRRPKEQSGQPLRSREVSPHRQPVCSRMSGSKYEYVRTYERPDALLANTYLLLRIDGHAFHKSVPEGQNARARCL